MSEAGGERLEITVHCPGCDASLPVAASEQAAEIICGRCQRTIALRITPDLRDDRAVDVCPICEGKDFYVRKDFNPQVGVGVIVVGVVISSVFYGFGRDLIAYGVLAAAALLDLFIYRLLSNVTVCYRCHAEFRGKYTRSAPVFDLHTADVLEVEYERKIRRR